MQALLHIGESPLLQRSSPIYNYKTLVLYVRNTKVIDHKLGNSPCDEAIEQPAPHLRSSTKRPRLDSYGPLNPTFGSFKTGNRVFSP